MNMLDYAFEWAGPATVLCDYISYMFMFLSIATSNLVATSLARQDKNEVQHQISILLFLALACGFFMLLFTKFFGPWMLTAFTGPKNLDIVPAANTYVQIRGLAWPAVLVGWVAQSASLGMKDPWGPLKALAVASAINGIGDVVLCSLLGYGIAGAAWATMVSQVVAGYMMIEALNKKGYNGYAFSVPSSNELLTIFGLAAPVFLTMTAKVAFYTLIIYFATSMGTHTVAAHQVMLQTYSMSTVWGEPLSQTAQSFMPELLYGANRSLEKARMLLKSLVMIGATLGLALGIIGTSVPWLFPYIFTPDQKVIQEMHKVLIPYFLALVVTPSTHSLEGTLLAGRDLKFISLSMSGCFAFGALVLMEYREIREKLVPFGEWFTVSPCGYTLGSGPCPGTVLCDYMSYTFMFLSIATSNMVATSLATKDKNEVQHQISILLFVGLTAGLLMLLFTSLFGSQALTAFIGPKNVHLLPAANSYVQIRGLAWPAVLVGWVAQSASLGMKDPWGPLKALVVASAINITGDIVLCCVLGYGIAGAAWATMASQVVSAFMMINSLNKRGYNPYAISIPSPDDLLTIFGLAAPVFVTMMSKVAFFALVIYFATSMGTLPVAAHQVMIQTFHMIGMWGEPLSQTSLSFMPELMYGINRNMAKVGNSFGIWYESMVFYSYFSFFLYRICIFVVFFEFCVYGKSVSDIYGFQQAQMLLKSLVIIGAILGLILGAIGTSVPWLFPNFYTSDLNVIREMHKVLVPFFLAVAVTPCTVTLEGTLLAGRDLKFISMSMSGCFSLAAFVLLIVSSRGYGLPGCWYAILGFQWVRPSISSTVQLACRTKKILLINLIENLFPFFRLDFSSLSNVFFRLMAYSSLKVWTLIN
ncbi:putative DNA-damage-inducible protein f [Tripterygium wilfordii]|uniref:Protein DETOXIFICATION n=1 Tax=Tripterygium wilfordii TaxID=458696 RepID=A0A7J7DXT9_TRIWF|nr:putative DNA-damage-inducible protein f [Tripterygium wilfordii]